MQTMTLTKRIKEQITVHVFVTLITKKTHFEELNMKLLSKITNDQ